MRVVLHPEARDELRSAALWYDQRQPGLGEELVAEVNSALDAAASASHSFPLWPGVKANNSIRRVVMRRFPYVVAFETHSDELLVLAVAHGRRRPLYWLARATQT